MNFKKPDNIIGFFTAFIGFVIYLITLSPTVNFIDSGELAAVAASLGIAHPTGYPFFTLTGYLFSQIPLNITVIYKLNLMSAVFTAVSIFFFFKLFVLILKQADFNAGKLKQSRSLNFQNYIASASSVLLLAFSQTFWSQAVSVEVYSLHLFFLSVVLYFFMRAVNNGQGINRIVSKNVSFNREWIIFGLLLGISFTNHMTTILILPGIVFLYFSQSGISKTSLKMLALLFIPFIIGLSFYLYLPLRASATPILNWGNPVDFEKLFWHVSGKQYRVWIFSSTESALKQLSYFVNRVSEEFNFIFLIIGIIGIINLIQKNRKLLIFTLILFITCIGYSINYDIHDIDSYFLLAFILFAVWICIGFSWIMSRLTNVKLLRVFAIGILVMPVFPLVNNFNDKNESNNYLVEDYTMNMFNSIKPNGIIISYQWDYFISASYYFQFIENYRRDVIIIDKELLRRSWYFKQLQNQHPMLIKKSEVEVRKFLEELYKFEHGLPYSYEVIEKRYTDVIRSFIVKNIHEHPIYVTGEIESNYIAGFEKIPSGLCYQLIRNKEDILVSDIDIKYRSSGKTDKHHNLLKNLYSKAIYDNASFYMLSGDRFKSLKILDTGLKINPNSRELHLLKSRIGGLDK